MGTSNSNHPDRSIKHLFGWSGTLKNRLSYFWCWAPPAPTPRQHHSVVLVASLAPVLTHPHHPCHSSGRPRILCMFACLLLRCMMLYFFLFYCWFTLTRQRASPTISMRGVLGNSEIYEPCMRLGNQLTIMWINGEACGTWSEATTQTQQCSLPHTRALTPCSNTSPGL